MNQGRIIRQSVHGAEMTDNHQWLPNYWTDTIYNKYCGHVISNNSQHAFHCCSYTRITTITITNSVLTAVFQVNLGYLVTLWFSSTRAGRESLRISGMG